MSDFEFQILFQRAKCIGCNACVEAAPRHWIMSHSDGKSYLRKGLKRGQYFVKKIPMIELEENELAAKNCPVNIIQIRT